MGKALTKDLQARGRPDQGTETAADTGVDWRHKVSDHVAYGLLVYTGLHIFVTMTQLKNGGGSILPYFALVVLVVAIIPACRLIERRWEQLASSGVEDEDLAPLFRKEMGLLWLCAIGLPIGLTFLFKGMMALL